MVNIRGYLSSNFTKSFLTIFLPFFLTISLIFLVKISSLTSKIQINMYELLQLFSYHIPEVLFYTIPISFVAALSNLLVKLSQDNELIALYALGLKSHKIILNFIVLGILFSFLLLSISFLAMPLSDQLYKSFKQEKKANAKLNINAGSIGQKFGNFYLYVEEERKGILKNIVIYNRDDKNSEQFFSAKSGEIEYIKSQTSLKLNDGYGYTYTKDKLQEAQYETLSVYDNSKSKAYKLKNIVDYWSKIKKSKKLLGKSLFLAFASLIPLLSVYLIASFTMINPRYQSNRSFLVIFGVTIFLYFIASSLQKLGDYRLLVVSFFSVLIFGRFLFQQKVSRYF